MRGVMRKRIERARRVVFRMRTRQHRAVRRQQSRPLVVEILVGDDVEREALLLEPGEDMRVGRIVPQPRTARIVEGEETRPHRQHRAEPRGEGDAAAIRVAVIGGVPVSRVLVGVVGRRAPFPHPCMIGGIGIAARVIGVGLVGESGGEKSDARMRAFAARQHVEGQTVLAAFAGEMQRIGAARQVIRNLRAGNPAPSGNRRCHPHGNGSRHNPPARGASRSRARSSAHRPRRASAGSPALRGRPADRYR